MTIEGAVAGHYGRGDLESRILAALRAAGRDLDRLTVEDLAPVDEFHLRGREATLELAGLAGLDGVVERRSVLDVGGGIGGPARTLAHAFGCQVDVLDLTELYCRVGRRLTALTGLDGRVRFHHGSALEMPFGDQSVDIVWTQHSSMNIEDKSRLYQEAWRVLRPGGRLALYEIMAGPEAPVHVPVPWASHASMSFLVRPDEVRRILRDSGFRELAWVDSTARSLDWLRGRFASAPAVPAPVGLHLLLGPEVGTMLRNVARNLDERRAEVVQGVLERPDSS